MAKNKLPTADVTEDPHYHDTWTLLRKYRDVVWSLEVSVRQVRNRFRIDYGKTIEDYADPELSQLIREYLERKHFPTEEIGKVQVQVTLKKNV